MADSFEGIVVKGAFEHNLKNIDVKIPRNQITVLTGLSGSGKSSLAFDTIYAEGQRRYIESLSAYARQFLEQLKKPSVDKITGLSPAIAIDQKSISNNPRSTVGTVTEVYDFLRLLYSKAGVPLCPEHGVEVTSQKPQDIVDEVFSLPTGSKWLILAPVARGKKAEFAAEIRNWQQKGFVKARVDGKWVRLETLTRLAKNKAHDVDLVVDQIVVKPERRIRVAESINTAIQMANGRVILSGKTGEERSYSIQSSCPICGFAFPELEPRLFSFNHPRGYCPSCHGLGTTDIEEYEVYKNEPGGRERLTGTKWRVRDEEEGEEFHESQIGVCGECQGQRLKKESLNVHFRGKNIAELARKPIEELLKFFQETPANERRAAVSDKIIKQIVERLEYLQSVGAGYLSLDRPSRTLSGGEAQRIRLASQLGSSLIGVLYVLDEPSIGLHPRDHQKLLQIIFELKKRGNTILLVEHDEDTILAADHVIDIGPRAGKLGGEVVASGTPEEIKGSERSLTGGYLSGRLEFYSPDQRRKPGKNQIQLLGAQGNNLKSVDISLPLGQLIAVTGVSGSGKSTLIVETLYRYLAQHFYSAKIRPEKFDDITGVENIDKVIEIDQSPIGRTPRSTPATYVGLFPLIRELFAQLSESKVRGYKPGRFSFNVVGGRCEECQGQGQVKVEMHFLSNVFVPCQTCRGQRFNRETLLVKYRGKSIADVLNMAVGEACEFFQHHQAIYRKLEVLNRVGLDYLQLGQSSTTLSGGEAQRVKLSRELSKRGTGKTLYILDEPTTGLHFEDVRKLLELLHQLVEQGNTVLVIEHNLDVVMSADYVIDMGPEGGQNGGQVVCQGPPEDVMESSKSETGRFLRRLVDQRKHGLSGNHS